MRVLIPLGQHPEAFPYEVAERPLPGRVFGPPQELTQPMFHPMKVSVRPARPEKPVARGLPTPPRKIRPTPEIPVVDQTTSMYHPAFWSRSWTKPLFAVKEKRTTTRYQEEWKQDSLRGVQGKGSPWWMYPRGVAAFSHARSPWSTGSPYERRAETKTLGDPGFWDDMKDAMSSAAAGIKGIWTSLSPADQQSAARAAVAQTYRSLGMSSAAQQVEQGGPVDPKVWAMFHQEVGWFGIPTWVWLAGVGVLAAMFLFGGRSSQPSVVVAR